VKYSGTADCIRSHIQNVEKGNISYEQFSSCKKLRVSNHLYCQRNWDLFGCGLILRLFLRLYWWILINWHVILRQILFNFLACFIFKWFWHSEIWIIWINILLQQSHRNCHIVGPYFFINFDEITDLIQNMNFSKIDQWLLIKNNLICISSWFFIYHISIYSIIPGSIDLNPCNLIKQV